MINFKSEKSKILNKARAAQRKPKENSTFCLFIKERGGMVSSFRFRVRVMIPSFHVAEWCLRG